MFETVSGQKKGKKDAFRAFCRCSTGVALHPLKILVSYLPPPVPRGVAPKFGSEKVSRYTGVSQLQFRVSRYTVQLRRERERERENGHSKRNGFKTAIFSVSRVGKAQNRAWGRRSNMEALIVQEDEKSRIEERVGKNLAIQRIGKQPHKQKRAIKTHTHTKNTDLKKMYF